MHRAVPLPHPELTTSLVPPPKQEAENMDLRLRPPHPKP